MKKIIAFLILLTVLIAGCTQNPPANPNPTGNTGSDNPGPAAPSPSDIPQPPADGNQPGDAPPQMPF